MTTAADRRAHLVAGARVRRCSAPLAPRLARLVGLHRLTLMALLCVVGGLGRARLVSSVPVFLAALAARAGRDGDRQRAAALAGQAALPGPGRPAHLDLHHGARDRAHLGLGAHGPDQRGVRRMARRAVRLVRRPPPSPRSRGSAWSGTTVGREEVAGHVGLARRRPHPSRLADGAVLRAAVAAGLLDLRLVRRALPDAGFSAAHRGAAARRDHRRQHPAVVPDPVAGRPQPRPDAVPVRGDGLLPARLPRPDARPARRRLAVGRPRRRRHGHVPADPDADRAAGPHAGGHGGAVGVRPVGRLPGGGDRTVRDRSAQRPVRRLDGAARSHCWSLTIPQLRPRAGGLAAGVRRGPAPGTPDGARSLPRRTRTHDRPHR